MPKSELITAARLRKILHYNLETFIRLIRCGHELPGTIAGSINSDHYRPIYIDGHTYQAHRLAWLYVTGMWPVGNLDHKNKIRDDNRFCNLRLATYTLNQANSRQR